MAMLVYVFLSLPTGACSITAQSVPFKTLSQGNCTAFKEMKRNISLTMLPNLKEKDIQYKQKI